MKLSYNWLKEYIDFDFSPDELAHELTMLGVKVDRIEHNNPGIEGVVVGQVQEVRGHPDADKLAVCRVLVGDSTTLGVICGAPNVAVGQKVAVAVPGSVLPGGRRMDTVELRGVTSQGMICAYTELTQGEGHEEGEGILVLSDEAPVGADVVSLLGFDDHILELDLTPNFAAHCQSVLGVAREVAALTGNTVRYPKIWTPDMDEVSKGGEQARNLASVEIQAEDLCPSYAARIVKDVGLGESPLWMQQRLRAVGVRPHNNIVDITNYVMLELGQPLHAFDYDLLMGRRIVVRRARAGETIVTLDERKRELDDSMLVIADERRAVAVAGVMGGLNTEVGKGTQNILLESACFNPSSVRVTSLKLGLRSEASARFEKGLDPLLYQAAAARAAYLFDSLGVGQVMPGVVDERTGQVRETVLRLRPQRVNSLLGLDLATPDVAEHLGRLSFTVEEGDNSGHEDLKVTVPTYRTDVAEEIDLVEEVARLYGYDKLESTLPRGDAQLGRELPEESLIGRARQYLLGSGLDEMVTLSLFNPAILDRLAVAEDSPLRKTIPVQNPMSEEYSHMRVSLVPLVMETVERNFNHGQQDLTLFEIGPVYIPRQLPLAEQPLEKRHLAIALSGHLGWTGWQQKEEPVDFFKLKGILEGLLEHMGVDDASFRPGSIDLMHPGRCAEVVLAGEAIGFLGEISPQVMEAFGLEERVYVLEVDFEALLDAADSDIVFQELPRYQTVVRDMALLLDKEVPAGDVLKTIRAADVPILSRVDLFDVYEGEQVPEGQWSLAFSLEFQAPDRTLTETEISDAYETVVKAVGDGHGAELRRA